MTQQEEKRMQQPVQKGEHCIIGQDVCLGENVTLGHNCILEGHITIEANSRIESNTIIHGDVHVGEGSLIGANCVLGESGMVFQEEGPASALPLRIGSHALIRSGSILYGGSEIGNHFQTGHQVTIREKTIIGDHVSVGTLSDIQGCCRLGNYVRLHSNVHIGQLSTIDAFVWIYPYVVLTNDPTPPSTDFVGVHIHSFAIVATGAIVMPGLDLGQDCLIGAGAIVTKSVKPYAVAVGNPARTISDVRDVRNKITGKPVYPWREHFSRYMPWEGMSFEEWYTALPVEEKNRYTLGNLIK